MSVDADLSAYLGPIDARLLSYLDDTSNLALSSLEHLYRYAVALLQGLLRPEDVMEDWEDFFYLAGGFVFAYGSTRLTTLARVTSVLWVGREQGPLSERDRMLLVELTRELGNAVCARRCRKGDVPTQ